MFHVNPLPSRGKNKTWYFMWILCLAEDSYEISSLIFPEKQWKNIQDWCLLHSWLAWINFTLNINSAYCIIWTLAVTHRAKNLLPSRASSSSKSDENWRSCRHKVCLDWWTDKWMDRWMGGWLPFYVLFLTVSGQWAGDNGRMCAMELHLLAKRSLAQAGLKPRATKSVGQPAELPGLLDGRKSFSRVSFDCVREQIQLIVAGKTI